MQVIEFLKEHYEVQEVPFGRIYKWYPESVIVECDCGERSVFKMSTLTSSGVVCVCGTDQTASIQEEWQRNQLEVLGQMLEDYESAHHPWLHDIRAQTKQHLRDEDIYPHDSRWRYNDVTSAYMEKE